MVPWQTLTLFIETILPEACRERLFCTFLTDLNQFIKSNNFVMTKFAQLKLSKGVKILYSI